MRPYETIFIVDAALEGEAVESEIARVEETIKETSGELVATKRWGKRRLAYPIKKKTDGIYTYIRFEAGNDTLAELDRRYRLNENVLRYLTVRVEHPEAPAPNSPEDASRVRIEESSEAGTATATAKHTMTDDDESDDDSDID